MPKLKKNLVSTSQLDDQGYYIVFGDSMWKITKRARVITKGYKCDTLYALHVFDVKNHAVAVTEMQEVSLWHGRLGHMSVKGMQVLSQFRI